MMASPSCQCVESNHRLNEMASNGIAFCYVDNYRRASYSLPDAAFAATDGVPGDIFDAVCLTCTATGADEMLAHCAP